MYELAFYFARVGILLELVTMITSRGDWRASFFQFSFVRAPVANMADWRLKQSKGCKSGVSRLQASVLPGLPPPCARVSAVSGDALSFTPVRLGVTVAAIIDYIFEAISYLFFVLKEQPKGEEFILAHGLRGYSLSRWEDMAAEAVTAWGGQHGWWYRVLSQEAMSTTVSRTVP